MGILFNNPTRRRIVSNPELIDDWAEDLETSFETDDNFDFLRFDPDDTIDDLYSEIEDEYLNDQSDIVNGYRPSANVSVTYTAGMNLGAAIAEAVNEHTDDFGGIDYESPASKVISYLEDDHDIDDEFSRAVTDGARYHSKMTAEDEDYHRVGNKDRLSISIRRD